MTKLEVFTAHNAKCLSKTLDYFFGKLFLPVSKLKSVFREKPSNSRAKIWQKSRSMGQKKKYCAPPAPSF